MDDRASHTNYVALVLFLAAVVGAWWYLNVYDTAKGKCERGDLNACIVWQAENPTAPSVPDLSPLH